MTRSAPFFAEVAEGPEGGRAVWVRADDGARLRVGLWEAGDAGTVLLFPGRTEYIEKYGRVAADLARAGYATAAIDWRGQGLSDRSLDDPNTGHVLRFADYQLDVAAMLGAVDAAGLPGPRYLLAHSMGGAIGLGWLMAGATVAAAAFSAPMWGIGMATPMRPVAWALSWGARQVRMGHAYVPGTRPLTYVEEAGFDGNMLTSDPEAYDYMRRQCAAHPELALGGPSLHWLYEALAETRRLEALPSPEVPALIFVGTRERIVDPRAVEVRAGAWPGARLEIVEDAEHELLMERAELRAPVISAITGFYARYAGADAAAARG